MVFGLVGFGEGIDDARLGSDFPGKIFVVDGVAHAHALIVDQGQFVCLHCARVVAVEAWIEAIEVRVHV